MKKLLSLTLVLIICFALFACGGENATSTTTTTKSEAVADTTTTTAATTTTTEAPTTADVMTKQKAQEIAEELVERHNYYDTYTTFCDVEYFWPLGDGEEAFNELVDNI